MQASQPLTTLVCVPTYNEADNVPALVEGLSRHVPHAHVLFIDDNSQDETQSIIEDFIAKAPAQYHLIRRPGKLGLGTAYVAGFKWALERGYEAVVEMDADLSHRPEDLATILETLPNHSVVIGSRYVDGGATENWGLGRKIISRLGSLYARLILGMNITDFTGGFNAWRREVLEAIDVDSIRSEGYSFQIELKFRAMLAGHEIHEVPIVFVERRAGHSKMSSHIVREAMIRVWQLAAQRKQLIARIGAS